MGKYDSITEPNKLDVEMLRQIDFLQTLTKDEVIGRYIERITKLNADCKLWKFAAGAFCAGLILVVLMTGFLL